ncbi:MAG TPA: bifunctional DNA primase/polymerase, partial [Mycobacterium sp.]|nr:bifunctional DNA primase/polymerase [Mycobacterium sp.]
MFVRTTCRSCGGPLLLGSGASSRGPAKIGWWEGFTPWHEQEPCRPVLYQRDVLEEDLSRAFRVLATADTDEMAAQWEDKCRNLEQQIKELDAAPPKLLEAAVQYAKWGWPVFPIMAWGKKPAISKEQGGNGFKDATTDTDRVRRWWEQHPDHNIGIATGHLFEVIDVDTEKITASGIRKDSGYPMLERML